MLLKKIPLKKNLQKFFSSCQKTLSKLQKKAQDNDKVHEEN